MCRHVATQAKLLNESDDWRKALALMRKIAMKQLGLTKEQANMIGVHPFLHHAPQCVQHDYEMRKHTFLVHFP